MTYIFMDQAGVVQCIRDDPVYSVYRFEDMVYEGEFPFDPDRPIAAGMRLLYVDDVDGETILCHVNNAEKNDVDGTVLVTAEHVFLHDALSHIKPTGAGEDGFTFDWSATDKELTAFIGHYLPAGWVIGDVSPLIAPSTPGSVATYKVTTSGGRLNMRKKASLSADIVKAYNNGTIVKLVSSSNPDWYKVEAPDGKIGYMYADNLTLVSSSGAASSTYTVNVEIIGGVSYKKLYDGISKRYAVRIVPRIDVDGTTITKYIDITVGEPMFSGGRISLAQTISNLSHIVDDSEVITTIYPVTDDGAYALTDVAETVLDQSKTADTIIRVGRCLKNTTRIAELGEERVRVVSFDPAGIKSREDLRNAALDYLIYYRDPQVMVDGTAADLYAQGYGGEPIRYGDLEVVELENDPNVTAMVSALTRNYLKPEQTLVTVGTYRRDFATAGNTPISVSGSISVTGGFGGGAVGGIADLTINDAGQLVVRYTSGATKNLGSISNQTIGMLTSQLDSIVAGLSPISAFYSLIAEIAASQIPVTVDEPGEANDGKLWVDKSANAIKRWDATTNAWVTIGVTVEALEDMQEVIDGLRDRIEALEGGS